MQTSDTRITHIASLPNRVNLLEKVINSLLPQIDIIVVMLNGYKEIPKFLINKKILVRLNKKNLGDRAKFQEIKKCEGFIFTCDDDIIYPSDYADFMIKKITEYNCPVTLHGKNYNPSAEGRVDFLNPAKVFHCLKGFNEDNKVDIAGTGVLAFHSDMIDIRYADFEKENMADLYFSKVAKEQSVKIMAVAHTAGYLTYLYPEDTIFCDTVKNEAKRKSNNKILEGFYA